MTSIFSVGILTVSDTVSQGHSVDKSAPAIQHLLSQDGAHWSVALGAAVSDDVDQIQGTLKLWSSHRKLDLVLTTGGTGFAQRDVTPEAVLPLLTKQAPGLVTAMLVASLQHTPFAALSRPVCGVRGNTVIITLPGSPNAATENLASILPVLPHAIELARGSNSRAVHEAMHHNIGASLTTTTASSSAPSSAVPSPAIHPSASHYECHSHSGLDGVSVARRTSVGGGHLPPAVHPSAHPPIPTTPISPTLRPRNGTLSSDRLGNAPPPSSISKMSMNPDTPVARRARTSPFPMVSVEEATQLISRHAQPLPVVLAEVDDRLVGSVLAKRIKAREDVPAYPASILDGYAVLSSDGPGTYPVLPLPSTAGGSSRGAVLTAGRVVRVATGAPIPEGADAVVKVEDTRLVEGSSDGRVEERVEIRTRVHSGLGIREVASDLARGTVLLEASELIGDVGGEVGLLISAGLREVSVYRRPVIAVLSTGDELVDTVTSEGPLEHGRVRDANRPALLAAIRAAGYTGIDGGIVVDESAAVETRMRSLLGEGGCDLLITTGGVSMGERDVLKSVVEWSLGGSIHFGRVNMKPGKPTTFATLPDPEGGPRPRLLFALPGNPVSALTAFHLLVLPALRRMSGLPRPESLLLREVRLAHAAEVGDDRPEYQRVRLEADPTNGGWIAWGTGEQRSSRLASVKGANALIRLPAGTALSPGDSVEAIVIGRL